MLFKIDVTDLVSNKLTGRLVTSSTVQPVANDMNADEEAREEAPDRGQNVWPYINNGRRRPLLGQEFTPEKEANDKDNDIEWRLEANRWEHIECLGKSFFGISFEW